MEQGTALEGRALLSSGRGICSMHSNLQAGNHPQEQRNGALSETGPVSDLVID